MNVCFPLLHGSLHDVVSSCFLLFVVVCLCRIVETLLYCKVTTYRSRFAQLENRVFAQISAALANPHGSGAGFLNSL